MKLPTPDKDSQAHSDQVRAYIAGKIDKQGPIPFHDYMQLALYAPGLGYYSVGTHKLGVGGDFVTAPELSPLFSWCVARQCAEVLDEFVIPQIVELGAGSGCMALEILRELQRLDCLPVYYNILEVSADLKQRQQQLFEQQAPEFLGRLRWLDALPQQPIEAVVLANEVIDAMPVHRFAMDNGIKEYYVSCTENRFVWHLAEPSSLALTEAVQPLNLAQGYCSEINLLLPAWLQNLAATLQRGLLLFIDYGYVHAEYYHPQRHMGTLLCHYQHLAHDDPLILPGIQDITASVDFTALAQAAVAAQLEVVGFTHQAGFLVNLGLADFAPSCEDAVANYERAQQIKRLTLPHEMGERFKVLAASKKLTIPLQGFRQFDRATAL